MFDALILDSVSEWARSHPRMRRVWFFGSRVKGTHHPGSDIDVAIEIDRISDGDPERDAFWIDTVPIWRKELGSRLPWKVQIEMYADRIVEYVESGSLLVYERQS